MENIEALVAQVQQGETAAYESIVRRFQDMAVGYGLSALGDRALAEDAAQEAFISAYYNLAKLQEPAAFPGWFRRIVFTQINRLQRRKQPATVGIEQAAQTASKEVGPAEHMEQQDVKTLVSTIVSELPDNQREVVTLFYISQYSQKEISTFLEIPISTVKMRLHTARKQLKERMIDMVKDHLQEQRPSNDEAFAERVMEFINAADQGDVDKVTAYLKETPNLVDMKGKPGYSIRAQRPLYFALAYGHEGVVEALLANGAEVNARAGESWAPLHYALAGPDRDLADLLISKGAKVDIFAAVQMGDLARVKQMVTADPDLVKAKGPDGTSALHFASTVEMAQYLLDQGADIESRDEVSGRTSLGWLAYRGDVEIAQFLRTQGAIIDDIFVACEVGDVEAVKEFLDDDPNLIRAKRNERNPSPLNSAAYNGHIEVAKLLLERGADVNGGVNEIGVTPLHDAAYGGHAEMARLLLENGADATILDPQYNSAALGWAKFFKNQEVVEVLESN